MTAGAAAASLHDLNQESFMKIAVMNLSGWLHCFFSQLQPWQRHTLMTAK
jgi:hypothetical protein